MTGRRWRATDSGLLPCIARWTAAVLAFPACAWSLLAALPLVVGCTDDSGTPATIDAALIVPAPLRPWNGEMTGSVYAARALRPRFQWKAVAAATSYDLQVDDSCAAAGFALCPFASPEIDSHGLTATTFDPAHGLPVGMQQPVGRRSYWRVRACHAGGCSRWSAVRYVDVGRMDTDLNGDGYADAIVGSDPGGASAGHAFIYFGGAAPLPEAPDLILPGARVGDGFAYALTPAGDVNGDGYPDLVVGAYVDATTGDAAGRAYIYLGRATPSTVPDLTLSGAAGDLYGLAVSSAGDLNGDGYADFAIGAPGVGAGRVEVFYGGPTLHQRPDLTLTGEVSGDFFGYPLRTVGDVNGDGFADLAAAAEHSGHAGVAAGRAYLYLGAADMNGKADLALDGEAAGDAFGSGLAGGDVDGDGYADLAVGAYLNDGAGTDAGRVYLYRGGPALRTAPDATFSGPGANAKFAAHALADLNGDGLADLMVGASPIGGFRAFVYYGRATMMTTPDLSMPGDDQAVDVIAAGDVDGDGFDDVIVGASTDTVGHAYLYRGGTTPSTAAAATLTGLPSGDSYGTCVAWAGEDASDPSL